MAWLTEVPGMDATEDRFRKAISFPVGAVSPLWLAFGAAASAGVAFWWLTRWSRPANVEAFMRSAEAPAAEFIEAATETVEIIAETLEETAEDVSEAMADAEAEAEAEPEPEIAAEAAPEPEPAPADPDDLTRIGGIGPKLSEPAAERGG